MKKGDKVHCIKNRYSINLNVIHTKGKKYTINDISSNIVLIESNDGYYGHCIFYIDAPTSGSFIFSNVFSEFFLTEKEMRNLKLKNLTDVENK